MCFFKKFRIRSLTKKIMQLQQQRLSQQVSDEAIRKEIKAYHKLNKLYVKLHGHKHFPFALEMSREMLRLAAQLHDEEAQYQLGKRCLEEAKWRDQLQRDKTFSSQANAALVKTLYEEAIAYLTASAEKHILGKRTLGTCYIFGWGVVQNNDQGLAMVVDSIAQENNWSKAPQIMAGLGLNRPEFFEALVKRKP